MQAHKEVYLIGFPGDESLSDEVPLLGVGHFGISLDGGKTIYGFRPSIEGMSAVGDDNVLDHLRNGGEIPGAVYNDTQIFIDAYRFSSEGKQTIVWKRVEYITQEHFERIRASLGDYRPEGIYRFPPYDHQTKQSFPMPLDCNNCATWPRTRGLWIADNVGHLRRGYLEKFVAAGATQWIPPDS